MHLKLGKKDIPLERLNNLIGPRPELPASQPKEFLINPTKEDTGFLFQIVSNNLNGLDVDKYDYLIRDSKVLGLNLSFDASRLVDDIIIVNDNICYPEQVIFEIYNMFNLRYTLHKTVYTHKAAIASQLIIIEIMKLIDKEINLSESIYDLDKLIRKLEINIIHPYEVYQIYLSFYQIGKLTQYLVDNNLLKTNLIHIYKYAYYINVYLLLSKKY